MPPVPTRFSISNRPATVPVRKSWAGPESIVIGQTHAQTPRRKLDADKNWFWIDLVSRSRCSLHRILPPSIGRSKRNRFSANEIVALGEGTRKEYSNQTFQYGQKDTFSHAIQKAAGGLRDSCRRRDWPDAGTLRRSGIAIESAGLETAVVSESGGCGRGDLDGRFRGGKNLVRRASSYNGDSGSGEAEGVPR